MVYSESADFEEKTQSIIDMETRFNEIGTILNWDTSVVLDIGGAGGLHAGLLANRVKRIYCADVVDSLTQYNGEFLRLLKEKFIRNSFDLALDRIEFNTTSAMDLIYRDNFFDFICSFNAFEHIPDPEQAFKEAARVLKPNGYFYLTFDPIWTADTGSHFYHLIPQPWQHLLISNQEYASIMHSKGAIDSEINDFLYGINRVRLSNFKNIFEVLAARLGLINCFNITWSGLFDDSHLSHPNFYLCIANGYTKEELLIRGMCYIFKKTYKG